jgi:hypothetical protein
MREVWAMGLGHEAGVPSGILACIQTKIGRGVGAGTRLGAGDQFSFVTTLRSRIPTYVKFLDLILARIVRWIYLSR